MPRPIRNRSKQNHDPYDGDVELIVQPSPKRPGSTRRTLNVRKSLTSTVEPDEIHTFIFEVFKNIEDKNTITEPQMEKLLNKYKSLNSRKREYFVTKIIFEIERVMVFLHEIEQKKKDHYDHIVDFFVQLVLQLATKELDGGEENRTCQAVLESVLTTFAKYLSVKSPVIRLKSCKIIGGIITDIPPEYEMTVELIQDLIDGLILRAQEPAAATRIAALEALNRLQNYRDREDPVIMQYVQTMKTDSSEDARCVAVKRCSLNKETLLQTMDRCMDISKKVRTEALKKIAAKVKIHVLTQAQVLSLLKNGLEDETGPRDIVINNLIPAWISHIRKTGGARGDQGALIDLVMMIDPSTSNTSTLDTAENTLKVVFSQWNNLHDMMQHYIDPSQRLVTSNMLPNIDEENMGTAVAFTWYHLMAQGMENDEDDMREKFLPHFPEFCDQIENRINQLVELRKKFEVTDDNFDPAKDETYQDFLVKIEDYRFEIEWLIKALPFFQIIDPLSRRKLKDLSSEMVHLLTDMDLQAFSTALHILVKEVAKSERRKRNDIVKELIEDLREQGDTSKNASQEVSTDQEHEMTEQELEDYRNEMGNLQMKINLLKELQDEALGAKDFDAAKQKEDEIRPYTEQLKELTDRKNEVKKLPSTRTPDANDENRFTYSSATKALILLGGHMSGLSKMEPGLDEFIKVLILPVLMRTAIAGLQIQSNPPLLEEQAIRCLGLLCSLSITIAREYFAILVMMAKNDAGNVRNTTRIVALQSVNDMALIYDQELTKDLSTAQLESIMQTSTGDDTTITNDTMINATTVIEDGPQTTAAKLMINVLRESPKDNICCEVAIDSLVSLQLSNRSAAILQLTTIVHIVRQEYLRHDMSEYTKAMKRIVLTEKAFVTLQETFKSALDMLLAHDDQQVPIEKLLPLIFSLANPGAYHKSSDSRQEKYCVDVINVPLRIVNTALETVQKHPEHYLAFSILKLVEKVDISMSMQECVDSKHLSYDESQEIRTEFYRIMETIEATRNVVRERNTSAVTERIRNSFERSARYCRAAEEDHEQRIKAAEEKKAKAAQEASQASETPDETGEKSAIITRKPRKKKTAPRISQNSQPSENESTDAEKPKEPSTRTSTRAATRKSKRSSAGKRSHESSHESEV